MVTPDRGVVWAGELAKGDKVMTETRAAELADVGRAPYDGAVYNLKIDGGESSDQRGSTMYANGFLVGDLTMQKEYEFKHRNATSPLDRLPADWYVDYRNSQERKARQASASR